MISVALQRIYITRGLKYIWIQCLFSQFKFPFLVIPAFLTVLLACSFTQHPTKYLWHYLWVVLVWQMFGVKAILLSPKAKTFTTVKFFVIPRVKCKHYTCTHKMLLQFCTRQILLGFAHFKFEIAFYWRCWALGLAMRVVIELSI